MYGIPTNTSAQSSLSSSPMAGSLFAQVTFSFIESADKQRYETIFLNANPQPPNQSITADTARTILLKSRLPQDTLAQIWNLSNVTGAPELSFPEFCVAMHLAKTKLSGVDLPTALPPMVRTEILGNIQKLKNIMASLSASANVSPATMPMALPMSGMGMGMSMGPGMMNMSGMNPSMNMGMLGMSMPPSTTAAMPMQSAQPSYPSRSTAPSISQPLQLSQPSSFTPPLSTLNNNMKPLSTSTGSLGSNNMLAMGIPQTSVSRSSSNTSLDMSSKLWAITPDEKARYDQIFRTWDAGNSGYISGDKARAVFMQSGLAENVLAQIWRLADTHDHGKLNADEFAVAMHLIHRKIAGQELPKQLPPELIPPSTRDLDECTSFLKETLVNDIVHRKSVEARFGLGSMGVSAGTTGFFEGVSSLAASDMGSTRRSSMESLASMSSDTRQVNKDKLRREELLKALEEKRVLLDGLIARKTQKSKLPSPTSPSPSAAASLEADMKRQKEELRPALRDTESLRQQRGGVLSKISNVESRFQSVSEDVLRQASVLSSKASSVSSPTSSSVASIPNAAEIANTIAPQIESTVSQLRTLVAKLYETKFELLKIEDAKSKGKPLPSPTTTTNKLDISSLLSTSSANASSSQDPVAAKAAAMLAARMAALGMSAPPGVIAAAQSPASSVPGSPVTASGDVSEVDMKRIESERKSRENEIDAVYNRALRIIESAKSKLSTVGSSTTVSSALNTENEVAKSVAREVNALKSRLESLETQLRNLKFLTDLKWEDGVGVYPEEMKVIWKELKSGVSSSSSSSTAAPPAQPISRTVSSVPGMNGSLAIQRDDDSDSSDDDDDVNTSNAKPAVSFMDFMKSASNPPASVATQQTATQPTPTAAKQEPAKRVASTPQPFDMQSILARAKEANRNAKVTSHPTPTPPIGPSPVSPASSTTTTFQPPAVIPAPPAQPQSQPQKTQQSSTPKFSSPFSPVQSSQPTFNPPAIPRRQSTDNLKEKISIFESNSSLSAIPPALPAPRVHLTSTLKTSTSSNAVSSLAKDRPATSTTKTLPKQFSDDFSSFDDEPKVESKQAPSSTVHAVNVIKPSIDDLQSQKDEIAKAARLAREKAQQAEQQQASSKVDSAKRQSQIHVKSGAVDAFVQKREKEAQQQQHQHQQNTSASTGVKKSTSTQDFKPKIDLSSDKAQASGTGDSASNMSMKDKIKMLQSTMGSVGESSDNNGTASKVPSVVPTVTATSTPTVSVSSPEKSTSSSLSPLFFVEAMYDYEPTNNDDLRLLAGDKLAVLKEDGEWSFGHVDGASSKRGWFPTNYTEPWKETVGASFSKSDGLKPLAAANSLSPQKDPFATNIKTAVKDYICRAEALYDFASERDDELPMEAGMIVHVLEKTEQEWWLVRNPKTNAVGLVPANYVTELPEISENVFLTPSVSRQPTDLEGSGNNPFGSALASNNPFASSFALNAKPDPALLGPSPAALRKASAVGGGTGGFKNELERKLSVKSIDSISSFENANGYDMSSGNNKVLSKMVISSVNVMDAMDNFGGANDGPTAQTWASSVSASVLDSMSKEERKRQEAIFELISTEQSYVRDLNMVIEIIYTPMRKLIATHEISAIFANFEELLVCNSVILSDLEKRQQDDRFVVSKIGELFLRHIDSLNCYTIYCSNQMAASKFLQKKRSDDKTLGDFLKQVQKNPRCRSLDLSSYLLQPMQRITRYSLLLRQILHHTPKTHVDHPGMLKALDECERFVEKVNEAARQQDNIAKLDEISRSVDMESLGEQKLDLFAPTRCLGPRQFICEGQLMKVKSGRKIHGILFNDLLLLTEKASGSKYQYQLYRNPMPLNEVLVRDVPANSKERQTLTIDDSCFQIVHLQDIISVKASSVSEKRKWVNQIDSQCNLFVSVERKLQTTGQLDKHSPAAGFHITPIGTLQVTIVEGKGLQSSAPKSDIYCIFQLNRQQLKTRIVKDTANPKWGQSLMFSVISLDEALKITVYNYDKFSQDEVLGHATINLDLLEYYGEKETEKITLNLQQNPSASVVIQMSYRTTTR